MKCKNIQKWKQEWQTKNSTLLESWNLLTDLKGWSLQNYNLEEKKE